MIILDDVDCCAGSTWLSCDIQVAEANTYQIWGRKGGDEETLGLHLLSHHGTGQAFIFNEALVMVCLTDVEKFVIRQTKKTTERAKQI